MSLLMTVFAAETWIAPKATLLPMASPKYVVPAVPAFTVKLCAPVVVPSTVLIKLILAPAATVPLLVVSKILVGGVPTPLNTTGPLKV